jgi:hypothetical protein
MLRRSMTRVKAVNLCGYKESLCQGWEKVVSSTLLLITNIAGVLHAKSLVGALLLSSGISDVYRLFQSCNL